MSLQPLSQAKIGLKNFACNLLTETDLRVEQLFHTYAHGTKKPIFHLRISAQGKQKETFTKLPHYRFRCSVTSASASSPCGPRRRRARNAPSAKPAATAK